VGWGGGGIGCGCVVGVGGGGGGGGVCCEVYIGPEDLYLYVTFTRHIIGLLGVVEWRVKRWSQALCSLYVSFWLKLCGFYGNVWTSGMHVCFDYCPFLPY
jgi:hypothetical protein